MRYFTESACLSCPNMNAIIWWTVYKEHCNFMWNILFINSTRSNCWKKNARLAFGNLHCSSILTISSFFWFLSSQSYLTLNDIIRSPVFLWVKYKHNLEKIAKLFPSKFIFQNLRQNDEVKIPIYNAVFQNWFEFRLHSWFLLQRKNIVQKFILFHY